MAEDFNVSANDTDIYIPSMGKYIVVVIFSFLSIIGTFGNLLIIGAFITERTLRRRHNAFVLNLAVADLLVTAIHMPSAVVTYWYEENVFDGFGCQALGFLQVISAGVSMHSLMLIAANRYIFVCKHKQYNTSCTWKMIAISIASVWIFSSLVYALPPLVGWSRYGFDPKSQDCIYDRKAAYGSYNIYGATSILAIPFSIACFCYLSIFRALRQNKLALLRHKTVSMATGETANQISKKDIRVAGMMFIVMLSFIICWIPYGGLVIFDGYHDNASASTYLVVAWLAMFNSCVNSWIYGVADKNFQRGYIKILCLNKKKQTVIPKTQ